MEFVSGIWDNFVQLAAAFAILVGFLIGLAWVLSKIGFIARRISAWQIRRRKDSCPMKIECMTKNKDQDDQLKDMASGFLRMHGILIALHCTIAIQRGYLPKYERVLIQDAFDDYKEKGGNHGVEDLFNEAIRLPEMPAKNRRITDE